MPVTQSNDANTNISHITAIEGLVTMVNDHLEALTVESTKHHAAKFEAIQALDEWQKVDLRKLRVIYE